MKETPRRDGQGAKGETKTKGNLPLAPPAQKTKQFVYDGRDLFAVIERRADGWHVVMGAADLGPFASREIAQATAYAHLARAPALPITGERERDAERVNRIRKHQRAENRRAGHAVPRRRGVIQGSKHRAPGGQQAAGNGSRATRSTTATSA
jgi:hypothetical protein